ncbi:MAG: hypothetical protein JXK07_13455 [Spirochaetes bacterium]|nr:hypothetical protein [Spirochaetota bacterium]
MGINSFLKDAVSKWYLQQLGSYFNGSIEKQLHTFDINSRILSGTILLHNIECAEIVAYSIESKSESIIPLHLSLQNTHCNTHLSYKFQAALPNNPLNYHYEIRKKFNKAANISTLNSLREKGYSNSGIIFGPSGSGKSYFMNEMIDLLLSTRNDDFIIIDSDYLNPNSRYFKAVPEKLIDTSNLPQFSSKSVLRIGDIAHSGNSHELSTLLTSILDNQEVIESSFVFINSGDIIFRKMSVAEMKNLLEIVAKKHLKIITSFQSISYTIDIPSVKLLAAFCDRFYFTSSHVQLRDVASSLLLEAKAPTDGNGYIINSIIYYDAPYIFQNIITKKDIYFLGPKTQGFIGSELKNEIKNRMD